MDSVRQVNTAVDTVQASLLEERKRIQKLEEKFDTILEEVTEKAQPANVSSPALLLASSPLAPAP